MQLVSTRSTTNRLTWAGLFLAILSITACDNSGHDDEGAMVHTRLIRMPSENVVAGKTGAVHDADMPAPNYGPVWTSEVTIHSLRIPFVRISLTDENETLFNTVYGCDPASDPNGCLVNLHGAALQNLLSAFPQHTMPGTYTHVVISNCVDGKQEYSARVAGSAMLGGKLMNTKADGTLSEIGPAEEASVPFTECARKYPLSEPLVITESTNDIPRLQLYFDLLHIARIADGSLMTSTAYVPEGCSGVHPIELEEPESFVCIAYPDIVATIDTETPRFERYRLNHYATLGLFFHPETDEPLGGYTRRYHIETEYYVPGFGSDAPLRSVSANADGTYTFTSSGSDEHYAFKLLNFKRADHIGTCACTDWYSKEEQTRDYVAVKLTD